MHTDMCFFLVLHLIRPLGTSTSDLTMGGGVVEFGVPHDGALTVAMLLRLNASSMPLQEIDRRKEGGEGATRHATAHGSSESEIALRRST